MTGGDTPGGPSSVGGFVIGVSPIGEFGANEGQPIRHLASDFAAAWASMLPQGSAWPRAPQTVLQQVILGLCGIWGAPAPNALPTSTVPEVDVDDRAADLLGIESDPRTTVELLPDWERAFGLPDLCLTEPLTIGDRQKALVARIAILGGQSRQWFINYASFIGYTITIVERAPYVCGISRCGGTIGETPDDPNWYRWELGSAQVRWWWTVSPANIRLTWFRCGAGGGQVGVDPMLTINTPNDLECAFNRYKPAHSTITFNFSGLGPLNPFSGTP
jgi:uncharacterized protein YmfQ (DUF2313 family)